MDGQRFDELVRSMTDVPTRRSLLGGLTGGLLGGILGLLGLDDADAQKKKKPGKKKRPKKCPPGRKRCRKRCCRKGQVCIKGKCRNRRKPNNPGCTPNCTGKECGDNGCGASCGTCADPQTCGGSGTPGTCGCAPDCAGKSCGPDGCGGSCGTCPGACNNGQCVGTCSDCADGCCDGNTCRSGFEITASQCGHSGGICRDCGPGMACVNGVCTCTRNSCNQGCCKVDGSGQSYCDMDSRVCGNQCQPKDVCCFGGDNTYPESKAGCRPNETCVFNASTGYAECRCGTGGRCQRNQGCCTRDGTGNAFCDSSKRGCGADCIDKQLCCHQDQPGCNESITCAPETCEPNTGVGQTPPPGYCKRGTVSGVCSGACAAGFGYGNYFPEKQREVVCGRGSVYGENCQCWRTMDGTPEGANVCAETVPGAIDPPPCRSNSDCGNNEVCIRSGMSGTQHTCAPICQ